MGLKDLTIKDLDRRKASVILLAVVLSLALLWGFLGAHKRLTASEGRLNSKRADLERFALLAGEYLDKRASVESALKRAYVPPGGGLIAAVEDMVKKIGAEGKVTGMKPVGENTVQGYLERTYSLTIDGVDLNQVVNLIYLIENHRSLLVIKEFTMVSRFEDPDILDVQIKLTHVTRPPASS